ncbi:MAG TPA: peptidylprolyl isomerase [Bacteroidales bacterium]|nr:peptidylprolyl isomerase [Bacteroidales bacterium]
MKLIIFRTIFSLSMVLLLAVSCQRPFPEDGEHPVARVHDAFLYRSDLENVIPENMTPSDSVAFVQRFIENWVRQQVFLQEALNNLSPDEIDFSRELENYRNSLIIHRFEALILSNELDTVVTEEQLVEYYENHRADFRLREDVVRARYVKLPLGAPDLTNFRRLFRSINPEDEGLLEEYCIQNAATFFLETNTWLIFDQLFREVPLRVQNLESFLQVNRFVELADENYRYFILIIDFRLKGSEAPFALERNNIREIILTRRRSEMINKLRNQMFQDALGGRHVEIF